VVIKAHGKVEVLLTPFEGSSIAAEIKEGSRNSTLTSLAGNHEGKRNDRREHLCSIAC